MLVAIILISCAPATKIIPTKTAIPTSTFTPVSPNPTITLTPTAISTPTATPDPNVIEVVGELVVRLGPKKINDLQKIAELTTSSELVTREFDFQKLGINLDDKFEAEWVYKNGKVFAVKANGNPDNQEDVIAVWEQSHREWDNGQWHVFWNWLDVIPYVMKTAKPGLWTEKGAKNERSILEFYNFAMQKIREEYPGIAFNQDFMFPFEPAKCSKLTKEYNQRLYVYIYSDADNSRGSPQADWNDPDPKQVLAWLNADDSVTVIRVNDFNMPWNLRECR